MNEHATMSALQIEGRSELRTSRLTVPTVNRGEILIRTAYVGICGTDLHLYQGESFFLDQGFLKYPFVFGHEYTGTVVATGDGATMPIGTRVVGHCMVPCQKCDNCQRGRRHLCRDLKEVGLRFLQGAAAEYVAVPEYAVTIVPDKVSLKDATLTEPTVTAFYAVERTAIRPTDRVAVIGTGTLGLLSLILARLTAKAVDVIGVEATELDLASALGANRILRPQEATSNSYDVIIEASGVRSALSQAIDIADLGGRIALVGLPSGPSSGVDQTAIALKDITVHGILHGIDYYGATVDLFASGQVDPSQIVAEVDTIDGANRMFERMSKPGRREPKFLIEFAGE